jgi:hypothetical protein
MNDDDLDKLAKRVRDLADHADPFTKKRLLALAERYVAGELSPRRTPLPPVWINDQDHTDHGNGAENTG